MQSGLRKPHDFGRVFTSVRRLSSELKKIVYMWFGFSEIILPEPGLGRPQSLAEFFPHESILVVSYEENGYLDPGLRQSQSLAEFLPHEGVLVVSYEENGYLDPGLRQSQSLAEFLPHEGVWIVRLFEQSFQLVQLLQGEIGSAPAGFGTCGTAGPRRGSPALRTRYTTEGTVTICGEKHVYMYSSVHLFDFTWSLEFGVSRTLLYENIFLQLRSASVSGFYSNACVLRLI